MVAKDYHVLNSASVLILTRIDPIGGLKVTRKLPFGELEYKLVAFVPISNMKSVYCRRKHSWYLFEDTMVKRLKLKEILQHSPYMLIYEEDV
jgi:hypothetical protein